jgi:hypothetical protein
MKKLILIPLLLQVFACSTDEMDEERDTSTFTGLYDGYSWVRTEINQGVNQNSTYKNTFYIKDNEINYGYIGDFTGEDNDCDKFSQTFKEGTNNIDGDSVDVFYEVNTPEMLMIIFTFPEYPDEINTYTFTGEESTLYSEENENGNIYNEVYVKDDSLTWEDFEDFQCPN